MSIRNGFTLIETLVAVAILISLTTTAVPGLIDFTIRMRVDNEITLLQRLLLVARNTAINSGHDITVCPLDFNYKCTTQWENEITVFYDSNDNQIYESSTNDQLIAIKAAVKNTGDKLQYGLGRNRIKYAATGNTTGWGSNGTFKYCPLNHLNRSRGISIGTSGRLYVSSDINNDDQDEDRRGRKLVCR